MEENSSIVYKLEGANPPGEQMKKQPETALKGIMKKLHKSRSCKIQVDKLNIFMNQDSENIRKLYNYQKGGNF